ncbi:hypothetical protein NAP1_07080 [Erythrobacter sp. NAP1]|uniref:cytochrome b/b6 domain-containing protein n=1 Tax=Erythrobacter sp. NAP1 TaxID=237727 RepID=UPI00006869F8|nr:cytochrome b/b6 domain-containing protein [Erythrobacter sp. NAP1]EAQ30522.1 hypothetical protein NAP1_07080 [Erythrobacter sp. NAP1]
MKRHALSTRIWHWINAVAFIVLFGSGLTISNAHRYLYWGDYGFDPADAWLRVMRFPSWMTIPQRYDLAEARDWHNLSAWIFALALLFMWIASLINRHFWRDVATSPGDWSPRRWLEVIKSHISGDHEQPSKFNPLQRIMYGLVLGILLPLMVFTGLAMSPGFEPIAPWLVDILGGRQSARSLHFLAAWALAGFAVLHILLALMPSQWKELGAMITGGKKESRHG